MTEANVLDNWKNLIRKLASRPRNNIQLASIKHMKVGDINRRLGNSLKIKFWLLENISNKQFSFLKTPPQMAKISQNLVKY